jgi:hypothetical protein
MEPEGSLPCSHWYLSWARSIQFIPLHPISLSSILIISTHLRIALHSGSFPSGFPTNILSFLFLPMCCMPCLSTPPWLDHSKYTWPRLEVMKLLVLEFPSPRCHFFLRSKYSPQHPVLKHLHSVFFLNVRNQVSDKSSSYEIVYSDILTLILLLLHSVFS